MDNLKAFSLWREAQRSKLELLKYDFKMVDCEPTSNAAKRLDFENEVFMANICVWESGDIAIDAIYVANGDTISIKSASEELQLTEKLDYYLNVLKHLTS